MAGGAGGGASTLGVGSPSGGALGTWWCLPPWGRVRDTGGGASTLGLPGRCGGDNRCVRDNRTRVCWGTGLQRASSSRSIHLVHTVVPTGLSGRGQVYWVGGRRWPCGTSSFRGLEGRGVWRSQPRCCLRGLRATEARAALP